MPKLTQEQISAAKQQNAERGISDEPKVLKPLPTDQGQAYVYKLVACTAGTSKSSGRPQWVWELTLDGRYHPEFVENGYLEKLWKYTSAAPGEEWEITKMFHHFGYSNDTETDELINDEATVLVYPIQEMYQGKTVMKPRRFAYHDEAEYPAVQGSEPPFGGQDDPWATDAAPKVPAPAAAPQEDPWGVPATPAPAPAPVAAAQSAADEDDTF